MSDYYGSINLTRLWEVTKNHPELVKEVTFKDGRREKFININVNSKAVDDYGNAGYIKVPCKEPNMKLQKGRYYVADLKLREEQNHIGGQRYQKREDYTPPEQKTDNDEIPF